jgi:hypothetical protein
VLSGAAKQLLVEEHPLHVECWASELLGMLEQPLRDGDPVQLLGAGLVRCAERRGTRAGLAALLAVASVAPDPLARQAAAAARQLAARGPSAPAWSAAVGRAALTGSWVVGDDFGDQDLLVAGFAYPDGGEHSLMVLIDHNLMGMAKDAHPGPPPEEVLEHWRGRDSHITVNEVDPRRAAGLLAEALEATDLIFDPPATDGFRQMRALLRARLRRMPAPELPSRPEPDHPAREALVADFLASPEGADLAQDERAWRVCDALVDYRCDYGDGLPLRWSPIVVELCLLEHFTRRVSLEAQTLAAVPDVLARWVRYCGRRQALAPELVDQTLEALAEFREEFAAGVQDATRFGPAKQIAMQMVADGIDLGDDAAVQAWIAEYNAGLAGRPLG